MLRRTEAIAAGGSEPEGEPAAGEPVAGEPILRPRFTGDLEAMLDVQPGFARSVRGYDRFQVDNYVGWAETELRAARRENDHLLGRLAACAAEVENLRRQQGTQAVPAPFPQARPSRHPADAPVSERVAELLRFAADQAEELTAAAAERADRILSEARADADARLRKADAIVEAALAAGDQELARARRERAAVQQEVDDLRRQRDEARESLRRLTAQIGQALQAVVLTVADDRPLVAGLAQPVAG